MNTLESMHKICESFKNKQYSIQDFQSRLETILITDEYKPYLDKLVRDAVNRLEEIIYTSAEDNLYKYGVEVAENLIKETEKIVKNDKDQVL
ncbi:MAG: hypothetical protein HY779_04915 [Rubrobacteridae bacterium]|nr:hypothetical protein [Rubrobacteridae bacterium]